MGAAAPPPAGPGIGRDGPTRWQDPQGAYPSSDPRVRPGPIAHPARPRSRPVPARRPRARCRSRDRHDPQNPHKPHDPAKNQKTFAILTCFRRIPCYRIERWGLVPMISVNSVAWIFPGRDPGTGPSGRHAQRRPRGAGGDGARSRPDGATTRGRFAPRPEGDRSRGPEAGRSRARRVFAGAQCGRSPPIGPALGRRSRGATWRGPAGSAAPSCRGPLEN
jgi:hypothetical protein